MKLIVGLGNIGAKYKNNRHNVGFMYLDQLGLEFSENKKLKCFIAKDGKGDVFVKPTTMMNDSGLAVQLVLSYFKLKPDSIWLVHDDLDIRLGSCKVQFGIGPKVHNGVNSVTESLSTANFWRVRIGVDNRELGSKEVGESYVLGDFSLEEILKLEKVFANLNKELDL